MNRFLKFAIEDLQVLWQDAERALCRGRLHDAGGEVASVLVVLLASDHPSASARDRFTQEYGLKDALDSAWAARPMELARECGPPPAMLVLEDPGGDVLEPLLGAPIEAGKFLRLGIAIASALGKAHQRGLVHKDVKPANILVNCADGLTRLTGFGVASRLVRERQAPEPPEIIAGTLAYMSPEQSRRLVALLRRLREQLHHDAGEKRRDGRRSLRSRRGLSRDMAMDPFHRVVGREGQDAGEHPIERHA